MYTPYLSYIHLYLHILLHTSCNRLHHTATLHCNTQQLIATHCTVTHYNKLQHTATHCNTHFGVHFSKPLCFCRAAVVYFLRPIWFSKKKIKIKDEISS